jgi:hypothetical protein
MPAAGSTMLRQEASRESAMMIKASSGMAPKGRAQTKKGPGREIRQIGEYCSDPAALYHWQDLMSCLHWRILYELHGCSFCNRYCHRKWNREWRSHSRPTCLASSPQRSTVTTWKNSPLRDNVFAAGRSRSPYRKLCPGAWRSTLLGLFLQISIRRFVRGRHAG